MGVDAGAGLAGCELKKLAGGGLKVGVAGPALATVDGAVPAVSFEVVVGAGIEKAGNLVEGDGGNGVLKIEAGLSVEAVTFEVAEGVVACDPNKPPDPNVKVVEEEVVAPAGGTTNGLGFGIGGPNIDSTGGVLGREEDASESASSFVGIAGAFIAVVAVG